jgi:hypothetical protein
MAEEQASWQSVLINTGIAALGIFLTQIAQFQTQPKPKRPKKPVKWKVSSARAKKV